MEENEYNEIVAEITEAVARGDHAAVGATAARVLADEHSNRMASLPLLGLAALDTGLPMLGCDGDLVIDPQARLIYLAEGPICGQQEMDCLYRGESVVRNDGIFSGSERRLRAWAAFLLAMLHYNARDAAEAAIWYERALGLDLQAASVWGVHYYLCSAYFALAEAARQALASGESTSDDRVRTYPVLDWAVELFLQADPKCRNFSDMAQYLRAKEVEWGARFQDDRCTALQARGRMQEDGFASKFLFENALPYARFDAQRIACHVDIALDIRAVRYRREYVLAVENSTEGEVAEALSHVRDAWELAQQLSEAGQYSEKELLEVKEACDQARHLQRDREQLRNMSHAERQEVLDKQEQIYICREAGDLDRALHLCDWCLGRANRNPLTWWYKGKILMTKGTGSLDQAISCFRSAVALDPDDSDYWRDLGAALMNTGQASMLDEAIRCCQEGLKRNRACETLKRNLAMAMQKKRGV